MNIEWILKCVEPLLRANNGNWTGTKYNVYATSVSVYVPQLLSTVLEG